MGEVHVSAAERAAAFTSDSLDGVTPVPFIDLVPQYQAMANEVLTAVQAVFANQKFILGDEVAAFEREIAEYCHAPHAIGCNSGTDALILALQALDIGPGDEVITTPFSFFATASSIIRAGATPVFADIDPQTFNLDPAAVAAAITPRTRAIMPVHLFGQCCDMTALREIAAKANLAVVEDSAQAIGAEWAGERSGTLGTIACFSFFPTKNLGGAGDGGMLTTSDAALASRLRRLRVHGDAGVYEHVEVGMNSRLDALQAAVLRIKLRQLDQWTAARQSHAARYAERFAETGIDRLVEPPVARPGTRHVYNQYCVRIAGGHRDTVLKQLKERKVGCAVYYPKPLHMQPCFAHLGYRLGDFPRAEQATLEVLALPSYPELPRDHHDRVIDSLASIVNQVLGHVVPSAAPARRAA